MKLLKREIGPFPLGIWIALIALLLTFLGWIMQAYSLFDWEGAVKLGLQNGSFTVDAVEQALTNMEKEYTYPSNGWFAYYTYYWVFYLYWGIGAVVYSLIQII